MITPVEVERGIEVGHIFKLGYKFTDTIGISVSGPDGKPVRPIMGSYGIGVERAMAAAIEVHHDDKGIIWPVAIAPFEVDVVIASRTTRPWPPRGSRCTRRCSRSRRRGHRGRPPGPAGVELQRCRTGSASRSGSPWASAAESAGTAELTDRATGLTVQIPLDQLAEHVREAVAKASWGGDRHVADREVAAQAGKA